MIIVRMTLPPGTDAEAFIAFMAEDYFPAIPKGVSRTGQVTRLRLLQGDTTGAENHFFLVAEGVLALAKPGEEISARLGAFGAKLDDLGAFAQVAEWSAEA